MSIHVPIAASVFGTIGAVCWSVQLIPQIVINYRRHHATGLQPSMMMFWAWAGVPLGVYNIVQDFNIALQIQPQILTFLSLITWIQCRYYQSQRNLVRSSSIFLPTVSLMAAIEVALIYGMRIAHAHHLQWPIMLMAVLSAVLLSAGVLRHYWDIYVHRTVRGISFIFVGIDAAGDLFSILSLCFQRELDVLGLVIYGCELALWMGVFACGWYFNLVPMVRKSWEGRKSGMRSSGGEGEGESQGQVGAVALRELPSSTSVFRTPSCDTIVSRARQGRTSTELTP